MVVNRLQRVLINSCIARRASMVNCQKKIFPNANTNFFFSNSDRDFYSENNNVSQVYTNITKIQKKKLKNATIVYLCAIRLLLFVICFFS
jgi:hypothetical protein